jgi:hypothetical protein
LEHSNTAGENAKWFSKELPYNNFTPRNIPKRYKYIFALRLGMVAHTYSNPSTKEAEAGGL